MNTREINRAGSILMIGALCVTVSGCVTTISSKRVGGKTDGQEYALPVPLIEFVPQPDGTFVATVKLIPDPNNRYVVSASSFISSYTLDVQTENGGLLKKVSLDAKSADVAADFVKQAGELRKAEITAEAAQDKAAKEKAATASAASTKAFADAQLALSKAEAKLNALQELAKDPANGIEVKDIVAAQLTVVDARVALEAAAAGVAKNSDKGAMDTGSAEDKFPKAWGPVYYRVAVTPGEGGKPKAVRLIPGKFPSSSKDKDGKDIPFLAQLAFDTSEAGKPTEPEAVVPRLAIKGDRAIDFKASGRYQLTIEVANGTLNSVDEANSQILDADSTPVGKPTLNLQASGAVITASFDKPRDKGNYQLSIKFVYGKTKSEKLPVFFSIE